MTKDEFKTNYPTTMLFLLGREWHAQYHVNRVIEGCVGAQTSHLRGVVCRDLMQAMCTDY